MLPMDMNERLMLVSGEAHPDGRLWVNPALAASD